MLLAQRPHHIAVSVTDLARAKWFYGEVLGLEELPTPPFDFPCAWYRLGDAQLHLVAHPPTRTLRGTTDIDTRDGHIAIRVASYRQTLEHLRAHGITYLEAPQNLTPWAQIYVTDPDGNVIEFNVDRNTLEIGDR